MTEATAPARLTIDRTDARDVRTRQVVLALDGDTIATLLFGERTSREIAPGPHRLRAHNTLVWKTVEFDARPGEHVKFATVNRAWRTVAQAMTKERSAKPSAPCPPALYTAKTIMAGTMAWTR